MHSNEKTFHPKHTQLRGLTHYTVTEYNSRKHDRKYWSLCIHSFIHSLIFCRFLLFLLHLFWLKMYKTEVKSTPNLRHAITFLQVCFTHLLYSRSQIHSAQIEGLKYSFKAKGIGYLSPFQRTVDFLLHMSLTNSLNDWLEGFPGTLMPTNHSKWKKKKKENKSHNQ